MNFNSISLYGRTYELDNKLCFNFSASGFGFKFTGNKVVLKFEVNYDGDSFPYITIFLDEVRKDYKIDKSNCILELEINGEGNHSIKVLKRTESSVSQIALKEIIAKDISKLAETSKYNFLFFGDSITCGYGVLGNSESKAFKTAEESVIDNYAYKTARYFDAKLGIVAVSGYPIYRGIWNLEEPIKSIYELIDKADYYPKTALDKLPDWNMTEDIPDVVVINLGANDEGWFNYDAPWINEDLTLSDLYNSLLNEANNLKLQIKKFISKILKCYPQVKIIYAQGMVPIHPVIKRAVSESISEINLPNVYKLFFDMTDSKDIGANNHPGYGMHELASKQLIEFIKKII